MAGRFLFPAQTEAGREPQAAQDARRVVAEAGGVQGAQASLAQVTLAAAGVEQLTEGRRWAELQGERVDAEITPPEVCFGAAGAHLWQLPGARVAFLARAGKIDRDSARREPLRGAEAGVRSQLAAEIGLDGAGEGDGVVERGAGQHQVQLVAGAGEQPIAHDAADEVEGALARAGDDFEEEGGALRAELLLERVPALRGRKKAARG